MRRAFVPRSLRPTRESDRTSTRLAVPTAVVALGFSGLQLPSYEKLNFDRPLALVYEHLTGFENLEMVGQLYRMRRKEARTRANELLERFDPLAGWLFFSSPRPAVVAGHGRLRFVPPSVGHWRVSGDYLGTRMAAPSPGGTVRVTVEEPLD